MPKKLRPRSCAACTVKSTKTIANSWRRFILRTVLASTICGLLGNQPSMVRAQSATVSPPQKIETAGVTIEFSISARGLPDLLSSSFAEHGLQRFTADKSNSGAGALVSRHAKHYEEPRSGYASKPRVREPWGSFLSEVWACFGLVRGSRFHSSADLK